MRSALIIGAGSYVVGDSFATGVVLPSLIELLRTAKISEIHIAVRSKRSRAFWQRVEDIKATMGADIEIKEIVFKEVRDLAKLKLASTVAFICVPDFAHSRYIEFFIEHGVPTWVVKPLCGDGATALKISEKARVAGLPLWVDYHKRFDAGNRMLKEVVDSGARGDMLLYSVQYSQPSRIPLGDLKLWSSEVDVFQYIGCHYVDQIFFLHPACIAERVSATGLTGSLKRSGGPDFDIIHALVDFRLPTGGQLRADFNISWNDPAGASAKSHQRVEAQFENGRVISDQKRRGFELWGDEKIEDINPYFFQFYRDPQHTDVRRATGYGFESIAIFIDKLTDPDSLKSALLPWAWNTCKTETVLDTVKKSLTAGGRWLPVTP